MILLNGHSLTPKRRVPLESMNLKITERDSTATIVPADMAGITIDSWLLDDTAPGKGIVWRVKGISEEFHSETVSVELEHIISALKDRILFGEVKPDTITGNKKATTCTAKQAVQYILKQQDDWTLGSFGFSVSNPYKFDGDTLMDALTTISSSLPDAVWTYDMSAYPFKLNINPANSTVYSEMRASRNIRTITRTIDKSGMYTRFYPIGKDDLHLDGKGYVEKNTKQYGVVSKTDTDQTIDTKEELERWAEELLSVHAEPTVTIDVDGYELSDATGEPLDRLQVCRVCRVPLPEFDTTIQERISELSYSDKIRQPEVVKIRMENNRQDLVQIVAEMIRRGGGGGRAAARQDKEDHAWFEDTEEHVAMCAEGIVGTDADGNPDWGRLSKIVVDGEGIHQMVQTTQNGLVTANSRIDQNEHAITAEVKRASKAEGNLSSRITVTAEAISTEVSRAQGAEGTLLSSINQQADRISLVVTTGANPAIKPAAIVAAINDGSSSIKLSADHIELDGETIAGKLSATDLSVGDITCGVVTAQQLKSANALSAAVCTFESVTTESVDVNSDGLTVGQYGATWQSLTFNNITQWGNYHYYLYAGSQQSSTPTGSSYGRLPDTVQSKTIYYLGRT